MGKFYRKKKTVEEYWNYCLDALGRHSGAYDMVDIAKRSFDYYTIDKILKENNLNPLFSCDEYVNAGTIKKKNADGTITLFTNATKYGKKDLPADMYPLEIIEVDELKEHEHGFNIRVLYFDGKAPHLKSEHDTSSILWNIITLYHHDVLMK
jgi:hypothetical protein